MYSMIHYRYGKPFRGEEIKSEFTIKKIKAMYEADEELFNDHVSDYGLNTVFFLKQYDNYDGKNGVVMTVVKEAETEKGKDILRNAVIDMLEKRIRDDVDILNVVSCEDEKANGTSEHQEKNKFSDKPYNIFEDVLAYYDEKTMMKATIINLIESEEELEQYQVDEKQKRDFSDILKNDGYLYVVSYLFSGLGILPEDYLEEWDGESVTLINIEKKEGNEDNKS